MTAPARPKSIRILHDTEQTPEERELMRAELAAWQSVQFWRKELSDAQEALARAEARFAAAQRAVKEYDGRARA